MQKKGGVEGKKSAESKLNPQGKNPDGQYRSNFISQFVAITVEKVHTGGENQPYSSFYGKLPGIEALLPGLNTQPKDDLAEYATLNAINFLLREQQSLTGEQKALFWQFITDTLKLHNTIPGSAGRFKMNLLLTQKSIEGAEIKEQVSSSHFVFVGNVYLGRGRYHNEVGGVSLDQIAGRGLPILIAGKPYRPLSYYGSRYPSIDHRKLLAMYSRYAVSIRLFDNLCKYQGLILLIPDEVISSDDPELYFDVMIPRIEIDSNGKKVRTKIPHFNTDNKERFISPRQIDIQYGAIYYTLDIIRLIKDADVIKITQSGYYYRASIIDRIINGFGEDLSLDVAESAGVDLLGKRKYIFGGKVYIRADWSRFTDNPYLQAYGHANVIDFDKARTKLIVESLSRLDREISGLQPRVNALYQAQRFRRYDIESLEKNIRKLSSDTSDTNNTLTIEDLKRQKEQLKNDDKEKRKIEDPQLQELLSQLNQLRNAKYKLLEGKCLIDEDPRYLTVKGVLYVDEDVLKEGLKDAPNPLEDGRGVEFRYSYTKILNDEVLIKNPENIFVGIDLDWRSFLQSIKKYFIHGDDDGYYKYKEVVSALIHGGYAFLNKINRGVIRLNTIQYIDLASGDAVSDLAINLHRGERTVQLAINELLINPPQEINTIRLFDIDSGNMVTLYDRNQVSQYVNTQISTSKS